ncbi:hypothetical protein P3X46_024389 [Hevea brasiliensis]|uniref:Disease resistance RPP13-like protein 1 n=1 Tax=Hevea brasiliensis TaxID=3981 RepID=A0ABQ9L2B7_HEVBR|nr:putative disease resistance RPP13-like protein 1 isoform X1 [Hevea brasiliensis]XP_057990920.1 putative disease resistance RPP13-like protein 1 isoform X1 [Hevea brasiliensis]XP_057990922.1 putative disease resistance RPP13-like protein 1 isoform X1 [Hevea brasiliensis]XP_057990923.1 putative disease resistance RPP13-like protein 1 isoform X1 [Hevea brasiliensis]KAJ9158844.1 hypothetical protein P3X46_024389 [Hevea brasiliensis]
MSFVGQAVSFIAESALSSFIQALFERIECPEFLKFARERQVSAEINEWEKRLRTIQAMLEDAEEKQMSNQSVKMWLDELKDLAYDVEDILDEFQTESLQRQLKGETEAGSNKLRKLFHTVTTTINPGAVMFNSTMVSKMKEITTRFQKIVDQQNDLDLIKRNVGGTSSSKVCVRPPSTCLDNEPEVYGRDEDKRKILDLISNTSDVKVGVIPIFGMGGVGKTTLARLVYNCNDKSSQQQFHLKGWVCVSDEFDILKITKSILESITRQSCYLNELNQVQLELCEKLEGKKFLIVLDDVWNKNYDEWNALCSPLMHGAPGSRVIVTTRDEAIARMMETIESHNLNCISDENCWKLFLYHAFASRRVADPKLEVIRDKVIEKCGGLPLAARTLGGLLRSEPWEDWENVMNSKIWNLQDDVNNILPVLKLSYYHLPSHLKRCFAYCAIFPKDYVFEEKELVLLWMAEGLIEQRDGQHMEDMGEEYFQDLFSRSFFQSSSTGGFIMHDLVNDLAQVVAGDACFRLEDKVTPRKREKSRHSSYIPSPYDRCERFELFENIKCMRTFLPLSLHRYGCPYNSLANCVPSYLLSTLRCLRVLSFHGYNITELPDSIGALKHLRYLDLSYTSVRTLPETTTFLCNLQTMLLRGCWHLKKLPLEMQNLINLRHLDIQDTCVEGMPQGIEELKRLRTLSDFVVGEGNEVGITALTNLKFLQGTLRISRLENVANDSYVRGAILLDKEKMDDLVMDWGIFYFWSGLKFQNIPNEICHREVIEKMKPHGNLKKLTIIRYGGIQFPSWVGDPLFSNLVSLKLENCFKCTTLPQLGLLSSLKYLVIKEFPNVKVVDREFYGEDMSNSNPFPALETLHIEDMYEWEEWKICGYEFPHLRELSIVRCPKLVGTLPSHLYSLQKLDIIECCELVVSLGSLPVISRLRLVINGCRKVELGGGFSSANILNVTGPFLFRPEELMQGLRKLKTLTIGSDVYIPRFNHLHWKLGEGIAENEELLQKGVADSEIRILQFHGCERLERLLPWLHSFKSLRKLSIEGCFRLISLPDGVIYSSLCLEELTIDYCHSLISIGRHQLPSSLKRLKISHCTELQRLLDVGEAYSSSRVTDEDSISCDTNLSNLQNLEIDGCSSLTFLGELPASLKYLVLNCFSFHSINAKIESIAERFDNNTFLESIKIRYLPYLKSLPKNLHMLTNLHHIKISHCDKLKVLPDNMHNLTSLQELAIQDCPGIISFPEEGFPTNLTSLCIHNVEIYTPLFAWGLHRLTSLKNLSIGGCPSVLSFPQDEIDMKLPTSLTSLVIEEFQDLKYLSSKGFQSLTSLEYMRIVRCPKLASFPKNGLPPSLLQLQIYNCPLLQKSCQKGKGRELQELARIPFVEIIEGS